MEVWSFVFLNCAMWILQLASSIMGQDWIPRGSTQLEYLFAEHTEALSCDMAERKCQSHHSHLTSILTREENIFIQNQILLLTGGTSTEYEDSYLFGFMKKINISNELTNWTWRDKSTTTWKNMPWNSGQPDEHRSLEACGVFHINSGNWSDSADDFRKYICKRDNPCLSSPCQNNGTCLPIFGANFTCLCPPTHNGTYCNTDNWCYSSTCKNNSTCENKNDRFICHCEDNYTGELCEIEIHGIWGISSALLLYAAIVAIGVLIVIIIFVTVICVLYKKKKNRDTNGVEMEYIGFQKKPTGRQDGNPVSCAYDEISAEDMTSLDTTKKKPPLHNYVNTMIKEHPPPSTEIQTEMSEFTNKKQQKKITGYDNCDINLNAGQTVLPDSNVGDNLNSSADYALETLPLSSDYSKEQSEPLMKRGKSNSQEDNDDYDYCDGGIGANSSQPISDTPSTKNSIAKFTDFVINDIYDNA